MIPFVLYSLSFYICFSIFNSSSISVCLNCYNYSAVIEIKSDSSLAEVVKLLAEHKILSAPVVDVEAPDDASWIDRYIGIIEFAGIVVWILQQV